MSRTCLIFDLDGTLVDSERLSTRALSEIIPAIHESVEILLHRYRGVKVNEIFTDIEQRYNVSLPDDFESIYRTYCAGLFEQELQPFPGAIDMLKGISSPRCIASSGPMKKINNSLRITGLAPFFGSNLFSSYEIQSWKPDPGLYLHAAGAMGFEPKECVVIEDSEVGIEAAEAAGMAVLHFCERAVKSPGLTYQPFSSMAELTAILQDLVKS